MALSARGFERIPNGAYLPQARGEGRRERGHERIGGLRIDVVEVDVELEDTSSITDTVEA